MSLYRTILFLLLFTSLLFSQSDTIQNSPPDSTVINLSPDTVVKRQGLDSNSKIRLTPSPVQSITLDNQQTSNRQKGSFFDKQSNIRKVTNVTKNVFWVSGLVGGLSAISCVFVAISEAANGPNPALENIFIGGMISGLSISALSVSITIPLSIHSYKLRQVHFENPNE